MLRQKLLPSTTISAATTTDPVSLRCVGDFSVQVDVTAVATPTGASVKLQASNYNTDEAVWTDLTGTSNNITAAGTILISQANPGYKFVRASFAITSGSVTASAMIAGHERHAY